MKTLTGYPDVSKKIALLLFSSCFIFLANTAKAQENDSIQTLFKSDTEIRELWSPEIKTNSIQDDIGTLIGIYGGALINRSALIGLAGGINLGHPRVNYGYFGGIGQYIFQPRKLVHPSGQLIIAYGSTKDYENPKSGLFDNFWNISGTHFYLFEPGVNLELNLRESMAVCFGISYRFVSGLNENSEYVAKTHVTNEDMSGLNFNAGLKFTKKKKG